MSVAPGDHCLWDLLDRAGALELVVHGSLDEALAHASARLEAISLGEMGVSWKLV